MFEERINSVNYVLNREWTAIPYATMISITIMQACKGGYGKKVKLSCDYLYLMLKVINKKHKHFTKKRYQK